jgi:hypothetical protein
MNTINKSNAIEHLEVKQRLNYILYYFLGDLCNYEKFARFSELSKTKDTEESSLQVMHGNTANTSSLAPINFGISNPDASSGTSGNSKIFDTTPDLLFKCDTENSEFENDILNSDIYFQSSIPHLLAIFSIIDYVGMLQSYDYYVQNKYNFGARGTIVEHVKNFFEGEEFLKEPIILNTLVEVIRHPIAHNHLPNLKIRFVYNLSETSNDLFTLNGEEFLVHLKNIIDITRKSIKRIMSQTDIDTWDKIELVFQKHKEKKLRSKENILSNLKSYLESK